MQVSGSQSEASVSPAFSGYVDQLLAGPMFSSSPRRRDLLRYLVEKALTGAGAELSEYAIAVDVLGKRESFDQRIDSSVRSEISRLRKFMAAYYEGPGAQDAWRITFPARGYQLEIQPAAAPQAAAQQPPAVPPATARAWPHLALFAMGGLLILFVALGFVLRALPGRTGKHLPPAVLLHTAPPRHTPSPEAKALYLRGQYYWEHRTDGSLHQAIDAYTQAIVADSDYAEAYAGLAASYDLMPEYSSMPQDEAFRRAISAANKAISLDPENATAHRALAFGLFWSETDIPRAMSEFREAIRLAPNDAETHHWYATALHGAFRDAEADKEMDIAQQLAPGSRSILADRAYLRYWDGDAQAVAELEELEAAEPDFRSPAKFLARIDLGEGNYAGYLEQLHRMAAISKSPADLRLSQVAQKGWDHGGSAGMLRAMKTFQEQAFARHETDGYDLAHTYALLGEKAQAMKYLQAAHAAKDIYVLDALRQDWAPHLNGYPAFESFRAMLRGQLGMAGS